MAANLLLAVGGLLVVAAAAAFTAANWSSIGTAGRAAILLALAVAALAAPWPLARRGLTATAESLAGIGLALTVADTYLARHLVAGGSGVSPGFAAVACAVLAVAWAAYGDVAPPKGPRLAAIVIAQLPVPLAVAAVAPAGGVLAVALVALALLATASGDLIMAAWAGRRQLRLERQTARIAAVATWLGGVGLASIGAVRAPAVGESIWLGTVFILAAVIALGSSAGWTEPVLPNAEPAGPGAELAVPGPESTGPGPEFAVPGPEFAVPGAEPAGPGWESAGPSLVPETAEYGATAPAVVPRPTLADLIPGVAGVLIAVGLALPVVAEVPGGWGAGVFAVAGAVVAWSAQWWARRWHDLAARLTGRSDYLAVGGLVVLGGAGLWVAPAVLTALFAPLAELGRVWASTSQAGWSERLPESSWNGAAVTLVGPGVLVLVSLTCWRLSASIRSQRRRSGSDGAALAVAAVAGGAIPAAGGLPVWAALVILTALAAALLGAGLKLADRLVSGTASVAGLALAACAAAASLAAAGPTIAQLAALIVIFAATSWLARSTLPTVLATGGVVAAATGMACAVPLAIGSGSPHRAALIAAFTVLCVAVAAIGAATLLRRVRPLHAVVLDLTAGPVVVVAAALVGQRADAFSVLAAAVALLAAGTAWLRSGRPRSVALCSVVLASATAILLRLTVLLDAVTLPYRELVRPWHRLPASRQIADHLAGLPVAMVVLVACAGAVVVAAGAWRRGRGSLTAVAVVMPLIAAPAGAAFWPNYGAVVALLLVAALVMTVWAAVSRSLVPAGAALAMTWPALSWALIGPAATLTVLGCLAVGWWLCAWRARLAGVRVGSAAATVVAAGALAGACVLSAGLAGWLAGLAVLTVGAGAQLMTAVLARSVGLDADRGLSADAGPGPDAGPSPAGLSADAGPSPDALPPSPVRLAVESAGWFAALVGVLPSLTVAVHASLALAAAAALCLGVALRPDRRPLLWVGLGLGEAALCAWLAAAGVRAPEPYTGPAALIVIAFGWQRSRRAPQARSWVTYGPGLALLLLPSLVASWNDHGWVRPLLLGLVATGLTLAGGRARLQAPLLLGGAVAVVDAGRQLAPAIARLAGLVPRWVPIALLGLILLAVGATYEARLKDLGRIRAALGRLR